jgi:hypothetical protein
MKLSHLVTIMRMLLTRGFCIAQVCFLPGTLALASHHGLNLTSGQLPPVMTDKGHPNARSSVPVRPFRNCKYPRQESKSTRGKKLCKLNPGVDVMITILGDFKQFSAKKWRFSHKSML